MTEPRRRRVDGADLLGLAGVAEVLLAVALVANPSAWFIVPVAVAIVGVVFIALGWMVA